VEFKRVVLRELFEGSTHEQMCDLRYVFDKIEPFWDCCKMLTKEQRFRLAQCHAMCVRRALSNAIIDSKRWKIMKRLRQEEADRRGHGDTDKLYLYYPHDLVDKEYPLNQQYQVSYCKQDIENIEYALEKSRYEGGRKLPTNGLLCVDTMQEVFDEIREKLQRRFLM